MRIPTASGSPSNCTPDGWPSTHLDHVGDVAEILQRLARNAGIVAVHYRQLLEMLSAQQARPPIVHRDLRGIGLAENGGGNAAGNSEHEALGISLDLRIDAKGQ